MDQLCETLVGMGDHDGAISRLKAGVEEQPLREGRQRLLMTALNASGRRAEALRAF